MQHSGLCGNQVSQVRGFADQRLRNPKDALDPSNRRVSIIVQYINTSPEEAGTPAEKINETAEGKTTTAGAGVDSEADIERK